MWCVHAYMWCACGRCVHVYMWCACVGICSVCMCICEHMKKTRATCKGTPHTQMSNSPPGLGRDVTLSLIMASSLQVTTYLLLHATPEVSADAELYNTSMNV